MLQEQGAETWTAKDINQGRAAAGGRSLDSSVARRPRMTFDYRCSYRNKSIFVPKERK